MRRERVVCFLNHTAETGGAEFALVRLVDCMNRTEWHPVVVFGEDGPAVELFRSRSIETYVIPMAAGLSKVRREVLASASWLMNGRALAIVSYVLKLIRFFKQRAVEVVHTNSMKAHVLGGFAARIAGIPLVWHLRDSLHPACLPPTALSVMRLLARHLPDRIIAVSKSVARDALGTEHSERATVVYDGVLDSFFGHPVVEKLPKNGSPKWIVGMVGRFSEWKGQHLFLEAAARLIEQGVPICFELVGSPLFGQEAYANRLKQFVEANGLGDQIKFRGFVSDVITCVKDWDLLVHASVAPDPCPNVVIEAMASGVPVVGPNAGGVPELLDDGACGFLFAAGDARALSECIEAALKDSHKLLEFIVLARKRAGKYYRAGRVSLEVESVWKQFVTTKVFARRTWPWIEENPAKWVQCLTRKGSVARGSVGHERRTKTTISPKQCER
jgi:glycosyltransferase involved in cell wall biosynthesis